MRSIATYLVVLGLVSTVWAQERAPLRGRVVVEVATCCGGAVVPPGTDCTTEEVYVGEVTFRRGRRNRGRAVARVTTDDAGRFRVSLPAGTYCVGASDHAFGDEPAGVGAGTAAGTVDATCLEARRLGCDAVVTVPRAGAITVRTERPCFGHCYAGPWPG
jgi:hypothetical protein